MVVKENLRPMFAATVLADEVDVTGEVTLLLGDAFALWNFSQATSGCRITTFDCMARKHGDGAWISRSVEEVWTLSGHEKFAAYLRFHEEPDVLFDAYTMSRLSFKDVLNKKMLLKIRPISHAEEHMESSVVIRRSCPSQPSKRQQHVQVS